MKRIISLFTLLTIFLGTYAQTDEAKYNYMNKTITRNADGSTDENVSFSLTLYTYTATNYTYGQTYIIYNPEYQQVTINEAYTIQKDGKKVPLPERAIAEVLPSWAAKATDFNHLLEKVIVHTGLELGCTVYLDYTIHSAPGFNKNMDFSEQYDQTSPIAKLTYTLNVPESTKLHSMMCSPDGNIKPAADNIANGQRTVQYTIADIPARSKDSYQVSNVTKKYNFFCTTSDFETEMKELFYSGIDSDIQAWADNMVKNQPDAMARYKFIRNYVTNEFSIVNVPISVSNGIRPMQKIRRGAYITPYEQAALLHQMLTACNIKSDVRVSFNQSLPMEFRTINNVQKFYVAQRYGEVEKTLDPSSNSAEVKPAMTVGLDREIIKPNLGLEVSKSYDLSVKSTNLDANGFYMLELPANSAGVAGWSMSTLPTLREVDFEIPNLIDEIETYSIKVDAGIMMLGEYATTIKDDITGAGLSETCTAEDDGTLTIRRYISLPQKIYTVAEYAAVRNIITTWLSPNHRRLLFVKK